jgi:hypothetical protein
LLVRLGSKSCCGWSAIGRDCRGSAPLISAGRAAGRGTVSKRHCSNSFFLLLLLLYIFIWGTQKWVTTLCYFLSLYKLHNTKWFRKLSKLHFCNVKCTFPAYSFLLVHTIHRRIRISVCKPDKIKNKKHDKIRNNTQKFT